MKEKLMGLLKEEEGQGMTEYGLIIALISVAAMGIIILIGPKILQYFTNANTAMGTPAP